MENNINKRYKSFTSLEQSKKLAEFLPLESSDGFWEYHDKWYSEGDEWEGYEDYPRAEPYLEYTRMENEWKEDKSDIPCWSLAALLDILPSGKALIHDKSSRGYKCICANLDTVFFSNPVDACVKMIIKLKEQNLL
jgi:hypothetical protein